MNVLVITHYSDLYGANLSMLAVLRNIRNLHPEFQATVLMPEDGCLRNVLEKEGFDNIICPYYWWIRFSWQTGFVRKLDYLNKQRKNINRIRIFLSDLRNKHFDVVYSNSAVINIGVYISCKLQIPHIWHFRESTDQFDFHFPRIIGKLLLYNNINRYYIVISEYLRENFKKYLPQNRINVIYNGVEMITESNTKDNNAKNTYKMCIVGVVSEQKNQLDALKALKVVRQRGYDVHLHIIGPCDDVYKCQLDTFIAEHKLTDYVVFYGSRNDVPNLLSNMDIGLMTSRDEAFGRVTVEYMLSSLPVIASNSGANAELVKNDENGYLYELGNSEQFADNICRLLNNPQLRYDLGKRGHKIAKKCFSARRNAEEIYGIFLKALHIDV